MDNDDVRRFALVLAVQAEIEGMKAENDHLMVGGGSNLYHMTDFEMKADELRNLANCPDELL